MTLQANGPISARDINIELGLSGTTTFALGSSASRTLAGVSTGPIAMGHFYGKSSVITGTLTYTGRTITTKGYNGAWGTNPIDGGGGWPYCAWGVGQGAGSNGTTYYPYITPSGTGQKFWYTYGCDNSGSVGVATTTDKSADPTTLTYTDLGTSGGFPGTNNWTDTGLTINQSTILWFKVYYNDAGGDWGFTFAVSNTNSSAGIVITSLSFNSSGYPTYTR